MRWKRNGAVVLIGIATVGSLYHVYSGTELERPASRAPSSKSPPVVRARAITDATSQLRLSGNVDTTRAKCVDHYSFMSQLKFNPSSVVTTDDTFRSVKRLLFFIGHPRSGSTLLGRLLDAHPHMTISHEFDLFSRWSSETELGDRKTLFMSLYKASARMALAGREALKQYNKSQLCDVLFSIVPDQWQGRCDGYVEVIGDKKADYTARELRSHPEMLQQMKSRLDLPMLFIYPIRHPLDMLSTQVLKDMKKYSEYSHTKRVYNNTLMLQSLIQRFYERVALIQRWMESKWLDIMPLYNDDLIRDPKTTLERICDFLHISCPADYVGNCTRVIFADKSRTRDNVYWPEELRQDVLNFVKRHKLLERYESDF